jgi:hypothetical protein
MPTKFLQLNYSFVCLEAECGHQFEVPLHRIAHINCVACPKYERSRDIAESKASGDIAQIMSELTTIEMARRRRALERHRDAESKSLDS